MAKIGGKSGMPRSVAPAPAPAAVEPAPGRLRIVSDPVRGSAWITGQLRQAIQEGHYTHGEKLPAERQLAEAFGTSRTTVRMALERGQPLSPELLDRLGQAPPPRRNDLRRGVVGICLGIGLGAFGFVLGQPDAGTDMAFDFPRLIVHAAKTRPLGAGTILGAGTVSNKDAKVGVCCLAEKRALETIAGGAPRTPFLKFGDRVRIEMPGPDGRSIFGAIEQEVVKSGHRAAASAPAAVEG